MVSRTTRADPRTRDRLIEVAGETFAERGFRAASIREVCRRARANVASVHYHFGSKKELYLAALRSALDAAKQTSAPRIEAPIGRADAPGLLARFVAATVERVLAPRPGWHRRLLLREFVEPTFALDVVVGEYIRPHFELLRECVRPLLTGASDRELDLHALSVIAQIIYYRVAAPVALRLLGEESYSAPFCERLAEHVTRFSMRGLAPSGATP